MDVKALLDQARVVLLNRHRLPTILRPRTLQDLGHVYLLCLLSVSRKVFTILIDTPLHLSIVNRRLAHVLELREVNR